DPEVEPRLKKPGPDEEAPKANHPFFWAGYLLVDTGVPPEASAKPAEQPGPENKLLPFPQLPKAPGGGEAPKPAKPDPQAKPPDAPPPPQADDQSKPQPPGPEAKPPAGQSPKSKRPAPAKKAAK
ncbi:MAG TPA: hypothetical protein PK777_04405, partial [Thermoguttaceae bacterium]|nr:hypothetical protein [Thermoguttaceae bacterium]